MLSRILYNRERKVRKGSVPGLKGLESPNTRRLELGFHFDLVQFAQILSNCRASGMLSALDSGTTAGCKIGGVKITGGGGTASINPVALRSPDSSVLWAD